MDGKELLKLGLLTMMVSRYHLAIFYSELSVIDCSLCAAMVIGFTHGFQTVSESNAEWRGFISNFQFISNIPVATLRTAESVHPMLFCSQVSESTAIVISIYGSENPLFDVVFGARNGYNDHIKIEFDL